MQGTDSEKAESMAEKLARWKVTLNKTLALTNAHIQKAQKASVDGSTSSLPLNKPLTRQKTNILPSKGPAVTLTKKKAQLPEPKKTLKPKGASQEMPPSVSKSAPSVTQTLPKNVFESALAIVDALCEDEKEEEESPPIPIQTRATPPRRLLPDARSPSGSLFSSLPNSSTEIPILEKRIQELELEVVSLNDEKSDFLGTISRLEKVIEPKTSGSYLKHVLKHLFCTVTSFHLSGKRFTNSRINNLSQ